jgi:hypothetical protein
LCVNQNFVDVQNNREIARNGLQNCFENFDEAPVGTTTVAPDDDASIGCTYSFVQGNDLVCEMTINNPNGRNDFEGIEGEFLV